MTAVMSDHPCGDCGHAFDEHVVVWVFDLAGYVRGPEQSCTCWGTWSAGCQRSSEGERRDLRSLLIHELAAVGLLDPTGVPRLPSREDTSH